MPHAAGSDAHDPPGGAELHRRGVRLERFTVAWNTVEAGVALTAGIVSNSTALLAFGIDSLIENLSALALLWRLRRAGPNADAARRKGAEGRALRLVAFSFLLLAIYVAVEGVATLLRGVGPRPSGVGLVLAALSLAVMPALAYRKGRTGREFGSAALQADAIETWVCAYLSLALLVGVGANTLFGWWWADPAGALAMLPVLSWQAWHTWSEARET